MTILAFTAAGTCYDHYTDFYSSIEHADILRCKHYCVPVVEVSSVEEIQAHVANIPRRDLAHGVFFRGATCGYTLNRPEAVAKLLFGDSCSNEPSLPNTADRKRFDYDDTHFALKFFLENYILGKGRWAKFDYHRWHELSVSPLCEIDYAVMTLAQHYGIPSHGLDITTDLTTAIWFATNAFIELNGHASYRLIEPSDWPASSNDWPVVYACQQVTHSIKASLHDCAVLDEFGLMALRPVAQSGKFFLGGQLDHQNRLAETVICAFRLKPGIYPTAHSFHTLFPSPSNDVAYRIMLDFANNRELNPHGSMIVHHFH